MAPILSPTSLNSAAGVGLYSQNVKGPFLNTGTKNKPVRKRQKPRFICFAQATIPPAGRIKCSVHTSLSIEVGLPSNGCVPSMGKFAGCICSHLLLKPNPILMAFLSPVLYNLGQGINEAVT